MVIHGNRKGSFFDLHGSMAIHVNAYEPASDFESRWGYQHELAFIEFLPFIYRSAVVVIVVCPKHFRDNLIGIAESGSAPEYLKHEPSISTAPSRNFPTSA